MALVCLPKWIHVKPAYLRALSASAIAFGLLAGAAIPSAIPAAAISSQAEAGPESQPADSVNTVTLITWDVVTLRRGGSSRDRVTVTAADGSPANVRITESGDDLFVYPQSALEYIAAGSLDKQLFNVTQLVADGYDDAHMPALPLIVLYTDDASSRRDSAVPVGAETIRPLTSVAGNAVAEDRAGAAEFWADVTATPDAGRAVGSGSFGSGITEIWLDGKVTAELAESTAQIGAPDVWAGGNTGQGVSVAVLDTGIDTTHPDFAGRIDDTVSFVPGQDVTDGSGHGTHVASTIAGTGAGSGGVEKGVAPGATLDIGKVLSDEGSGQWSWVMAGMEWAARDQQARIINMSLGGEPTDGTDPVSQAADNLSAETGALFVVAAGNSGPGNTIGSPGAATSALTVGAVDAGDDVAMFSSTGPRLGDGAIKPDITAPGVGILAARSQFAAGEGLYQALDGTSMATPHVAGAAALLLQARPDLTGQQLKDGLVSTSTAMPDVDPYSRGGGRVEAASATTATLIATGTVSVPREASPGEDDTITQPVTYTNLSDTAVDLDLTLQGTSAPEDIFTLSASTLTVPAHGTATVDLTTKRGAATVTSPVTGEIRAAENGNVVARTVIGLPSVTHILTLTVKNDQGEPASGMVEVLVPGRSEPDLYLVGESGSGQVLLPQGTYSVMMSADVEGTHGPSSRGLALFGNPELKLTADTEVILDASKAKQIQTIVPQPTDDTYMRLDYQRTFGGGLWRTFWDAGLAYDSLWTVPFAGPVTEGDFHLTARWRKEQAALSVASAAHTYSDVTRQAGTTQLPKAAWDLGLVSAGDGAAEDYAGLNVTGKAVVVRRSYEVTDAEQAAAASAAGAKLLLVANNEPALTERDYSTDPATPLEVALISRDEGDLLLAEAAAPGATVHVVSRPRSDYAYDVMQTHHNTIPTDLVARESKDTLARVDQTFQNLNAAAGGGEFRFDWLPFSNWGIGAMSSRPLNTQRTDWVSIDDSSEWGQEAYIGGRIYEVDNREAYRAGGRSSESWFTGIQRPYVNDNYQAPRRDEYAMRVDVPGFGRGDHVGMGMDGAMQQTVSLHQGDHLIAERSGAFISAGDLPAEKLPYRFEVDTSQPAAVSPLSTSTKTVWNFVSAAPEGDEASVLPMPQLNYRADMDAKGRIKNGATLAVTAQQPDSAVGAGTLGKPTLDFSYDDGANWHAAVLHEGAHGAWSTAVTAPAEAGFVSMRSAVEDANGNSISQTIIRAFGVRAR
jgi:subtilisin family serine protease